MTKKFAIVLALALIAIVCCAGCILPSGPVDPVDPVDPITPPVDPVVPEEPEDPVVPEEPVEPVVPAEGDFTVTFMMNSAVDSSVYLTVYVDEGESIAEPEVPEKPTAQYIFVKWTTDKENRNAYDFATPVTADLVLYADWDVMGVSSGSSHTHNYATGGQKGDQYGLFCSCGDFKPTGSVDNAIQEAPAGATITLVDSVISTDEPINVGAANVVIDISGVDLDEGETVSIVYNEETPILIKVGDEGDSLPAGMTVVIKDEEANTEKTVFFEETPDETTGLLVPAAAVDEDDGVGDVYTGSGLIYLVGLINEDDDEPDAASLLTEESPETLGSAPVGDAVSDSLVLCYEPAPTALGDAPNEWTITLMGNIDLSEDEWIPFGTEGKPFSGTFDGNGNTITIKATGSAKEKLENFGLIGYGTGDVTVQNLNLDVYFVHDNLECVGGVMGLYVGADGDTTAEYSVLFKDITVSGTINGGSTKGDKLGGIIGSTYAEGGKNKEITITFENCINNADISGTKRVGGIVGTASGQFAGDHDADNQIKVSFVSCKNNGKITTTHGEYAAGGIAGFLGNPGYYEFTGCESINLEGNDGDLFGRYHSGFSSGYIQKNTNEDYVESLPFGYLHFEPKVLSIWDCYLYPEKYDKTSVKRVSVVWRQEVDDAEHACTIGYAISENPLKDSEWRLTIDGTHYRAKLNEPVDSTDDLIAEGEKHWNNEEFDLDKWNQVSAKKSETIYQKDETYGCLVPVDSKSVSTEEELKTAISEGGNVILTDDIAVRSTLQVPNDKASTLYLNEKKLSYAVANNGKAAAVITVNPRAKLNITGPGTITFTAADPDMQKIPGYATNTITCEGTLTIGEGVIVENHSDGGASYAVDAKGKFTLDGGTLIGERCALRIAKYNQDDVQFTMNSGLVKALKPAWIQLPGSSANDVPKITVTIYDGTFQSTNTDPNVEVDVLYTYSFGNSHANTVITINGGSFIGGTVSIGSGYYGDVPSLTINGGTFDHDVLQWLENDESKVLYSKNLNQ